MPADVEAALATREHLLVLGGPGAGKTHLALRKAAQRIVSGLAPGQAVLFLSFSRAAVARLGEAATVHLAPSERTALSIHTFHSFFWELLRTHAYLLGCPKRQLQLLLPHDEKVANGGLTPPANGELASPEWSAWIEERERLFREEGRLGFDLFAPKAVELVSGVTVVRSLLAERFPLIIVDEAQDTGPDAWRFVELLSPLVQITCLGDLEQQIFDHLPGIGPERIQQIADTLKPIRLDLGLRNHRSPGTEIAEFGGDILAGRVRGTPYVGVQQHRYAPQGDLQKAIRIALARVHRASKRTTGRWPESIGVLAPFGKTVARISTWLGSGARPVPHQIQFDQTAAVLAARIVAFLLEPRTTQELSRSTAEFVLLLADLRRASGNKTGIRDAAQYTRWANTLADGRIPKAELPRQALVTLAQVLAMTFCGDPLRDWRGIHHLLKESTNKTIKDLTSSLDYLVAFNRGKRIASGLSDAWMKHGNYVGARSIVEDALAEELLVSGDDTTHGVSVMTIHKSKSRQFDAVILVREGQRAGGGGWLSGYVWRDDTPPYPKSRKILRVGITRARNTLLLLEPVYPSCPIVGPHTL